MRRDAYERGVCGVCRDAGVSAGIRTTLEGGVARMDVGKVVGKEREGEGK